jgi:hypothetical protein
MNNENGLFADSNHTVHGCFFLADFLDSGIAARRIEPKKSRRDDEWVSRAIVGQALLTCVGLLSRTRRLIAVSAETQTGI